MMKSESKILLYQFTLYQSILYQIIQAMSKICTFILQVKKIFHRQETDELH